MRYGTLAELERGGMNKTTKLHLIAADLNVSAEWLETGLGPKHPNQAPTRRLSDREIGAAALLGVQPGAVSMPAAEQKRPSTAAELSEHIQIGPLEGFGEERTIFLPVDLVLRKTGGTPITGLRWVMNRSKRMGPDLEEGAYVFVDTAITSLNEVVDGLIYAFLLRGMPYLRRIVVREGRWVTVTGKGTSGYEALSNLSSDQFQLRGQVIGAY